jgi:hypothetical protein
VLTTLATSHTHSSIASGTSAAKALTDGFDLQFGVGAIFCLVGAIAAVVLLRPKPADGREAVGVPDAERA